MSDFVPSLPQELITDIALRLPAKSVGRFRCVSKPWRTLLSSPQFIKAHLKHHIHDPQSIILSYVSCHPPCVLTLTSDSDDGVSREVICPVFQQWANIEATCHGLVVLMNADRSIFLLNPLTLEAVRVPDFCFCLDNFYMCGIGYDSSNDDYKIVRLSYNYYENRHYPHCPETIVDIYSVKMKSWRRLANSPYDPQQFACRVFLNGCIHWVARDNKTGTSVMAAFNLALEEFEKVPPPTDVDEDSFYDITSLGGCLALVIDTLIIGNTIILHPDTVDVWVMKEYGVQESWTKLTINCPHHSINSVLCLSREDEILVKKDNDQLVAYNSANGVWRDVARIPSLNGNLRMETIMAFTETLVSPNYRST